MIPQGLTADPMGTPDERAAYYTLETETGRRLRRDLDALAPPVRDWLDSHATAQPEERRPIKIGPQTSSTIPGWNVDPVWRCPFGLAATVYRLANMQKLGMVGGYEDSGDVQVNDAGPFDAPTVYRVADVTAIPDAEMPPPAATATRQRGNLQAGEVRIGDALTLYYSYATLIGFRPASAAPVFTDAYYSVRTEAHAAEFGTNERGAIVLPDPTFRALAREECRKLGHTQPPRADFTRKDRPTAFPDSAFFCEKPERGENPSTGGYVFIERDPRHNPDCDANGNGYRVKALYLGMVKADDPATGARRGDRKARPAHLGYGPATEIVPPALCKTEGGYYSFPNADRPNRPGPQINRP